MGAWMGRWINGWEGSWIEERVMDRCVGVDKMDGLVGRWMGERMDR